MKKFNGPTYNAYLWEGEKHPHTVNDLEEKILQKNTKRICFVKNHDREGWSWSEGYNLEAEPWKSIIGFFESQLLHFPGDGYISILKDVIVIVSDNKYVLIQKHIMSDIFKSNGRDIIVNYNISLRILNIIKFKDMLYQRRSIGMINSSGIGKGMLEDFWTQPNRYNTIYKTIKPTGTISILPTSS